MIGVPQSSSSSHHHQLHSIEGGSGGNDFPSSPGGSRLPGDHSANIHHIQDHQGQSEAQQQHEIMGSVAPTLKLRWMPPSLTTRTNAGSLREVVDEQHHHQMQHWMGDVVEEEEEDEEDDDDFAAGGNVSHVRRTSRGGYDMDQDDLVEDGGDIVEYGGENVSRLRSSIPLRPNVIPSSSSTSAASSTGIPRRLTVSTQGTCRPSSSSSSSRMIASSISPSSTTSFARSNSSLSPPSNTMSGYGQQHEIDHITTNVGGGGGGGCDVLYTTTRTENISREYGV